MIKGCCQNQVQGECDSVDVRQPPQAPVGRSKAQKDADSVRSGKSIAKKDANSVDIAKKGERDDHILRSSEVLQILPIHSANIVSNEVTHPTDVCLSRHCSMTGCILPEQQPDKSKCYQNERCKRRLGTEANGTGTGIESNKESILETVQNKSKAECLSKRDVTKSITSDQMQSETTSTEIRISDRLICRCCFDHILLNWNAKESISKETVITSVTSKIETSQQSDANSRLPHCCSMTRQQCCAEHKCEDLVSQASQGGSTTQDSNGTVEAKEGTAPAKRQQDVERQSNYIPLRLLIRGMDCADCVPRVERAIKRLTGTQFESTDYFQGAAQISYDPSVHEPDAIARFISRATDFKVLVDLDQEFDSQTDHETWTHLFITMPRSKVDLLAAEEMRVKSRVVSKSKATAVLKVSFRSKGPGAHFARDVYATLSANGAELLSTAKITDSTKQANADFNNLALRLLISTSLSIPTLIFVWAPLPEPSFRWNLAALLFATGVTINALPFFSASIRSVVFLRQVDLLVLVSVSVLVSWIYSFCAFFVQQAGYDDITDPFFETVALLVTLVYLGRVVQAGARLRVSKDISKLASNSKEVVQIIEDSTKAPVEIDARLLHYGDIMLLHPGEIAATDGIVTGKATGTVDESALTGENMPIFKQAGSQVHAGSRNVETALTVQVTKLLCENSLTRMTQAIAKAFSTRSPFLDLSDRLAAILLPTAIVSASIAFLTWSLVQKYIRDASSAESATTGLGYAISILVVSCPCALGLSVPLITSSSILLGAREGILVRSAEGLTKAASVKVVAFDKTGTLSTGSFTIVKTSATTTIMAEALALAMSKESEHPISKSVSSYISQKLKTQTFPVVNMSKVESVPGKGLVATWEGIQLLAGSALFTGSNEDAEVKAMQDEGLSIFTVTLGRRLLVAYGLQDRPKDGSLELINRLRIDGKVVMLVSGDNRRSVNNFARSIGIDSRWVHAECLPEEKAAIIQSIKKEHGVTAFVGDGTNDSVAFASADVSFAVASATDIAKHTADILLIKAGIEKGIITALRIAKFGRIFNIIGILWCVFYAIVAILLAAGIAVRFSIEPRWAGLGEVVSILPIVILGACVPLFWAAFAK